MQATPWKTCSFANDTPWIPRCAETGKSLQSYPVHNLNKSTVSLSMNHIPEQVGECMPDRHPYQTYYGPYPKTSVKTERLYILLMILFYITKEILFRHISKGKDKEQIEDTSIEGLHSQLYRS